MDLLTGLLLLWGVGKARVPTGGAPLAPGSPTWPAPESPPPARPVKRRAIRRAAPPALPAGGARTAVAPAPTWLAATPVAPPPPVPMAPPPPVHTSLPVHQVQSILNSLGANLKVDNLFGPKTAGAWRKAALARDLPPHIVRMAPQVVQVTTYTLDRLRAASGTVVGIYIP